ncbi:MAG: hypothetical protein U1F37_15745 [Alphaproteobacteria bacterium]
MAFPLAVFAEALLRALFENAKPQAKKLLFCANGPTDQSLSLFAYSLGRMACFKACL